MPDSRSRSTSRSRAKPTVFVVDDDRDVRESLQALAESAGLRCRCWASAEAFLSEYRRDEPGCLVLDVRMPGMDGLALQDTLARRRIAVPIIFLSAFGEVPSAVRAMQAGAVDFLEKPYGHEELLKRLRRAIALDARRRQADAGQRVVRQRLKSLTARERQVLDRLVAGLNPRHISAELGITAKTVSVHRANIMEKMEVRSLAELVRTVLAAGT